MKKKIIDFHINSYRNEMIGGQMHHISAAHHTYKESFEYYALYKDYCIRAGISFVDEELWNAAFPDKKKVESSQEEPVFLGVGSFIPLEEVPQ